MIKKGAAAFLTGIITTTLVVAGLTGCGKSNMGEEHVRLMVWSPAEDQAKERGEWLQTMCNNFAEEHPEWNITFVYGVADEATATDQVSRDPEASADVFMYANDRITTLVEAKAVAKFGGKYKEIIESTNSPELLNSVKINDGIYGIPFTTNTWYMFYDKRVFSEDDVKSLDKMLEKAQENSKKLETAFKKKTGKTIEEYSKSISEKDEKAMKKYFKIMGEIQMEMMDEELDKMTKNGKYVGRKEILEANKKNGKWVVVDREELEKYVTDRGLDKNKLQVTYCTTGVRASYVAVILEELGFKVRNYEPSFARYANVGEVVLD